MLWFFPIHHCGVKINQWEIPSVDTKYREEERIFEEILFLASRKYLFLPRGGSNENICVFVSDKDLSALQQGKLR